MKDSNNEPEKNSREYEEKDEKIETVGVATYIFLDKTYVNIKPAKYFKLKNQFGIEFVRKLNITKEEMEFLSNSNIRIEELEVEIVGRGVLIAGIPMAVVQPHILKYITMGKDEYDAKNKATARFNTDIEPELNRGGYEVKKTKCRVINEIDIICPNGLRRFGYSK